ncbi:serine/threonine protein kinase [Novipirellula artificiosorum]|uniref:Serine/threonine-protein kinase PknB n=1 Tax=Novipirellula artificiosorum TaxID=2528016 RepID=A0A5C6D0T0_9BACT|nr:serine/threonine-protein kinase [Novipirellula artificiosorum]TWU28786.1 Serine/threonine-protein kinase PknB [Novipirellula artificiosorum]
MNSIQPDLESIFNEAITIDDQQERAAYLDRAYRGNPQKIEELQRMIAAHFAAGSFLDHAAPELDATIDSDSSLPHVGQSIGPYKLREELGSGGFGVVWAAEQDKPIRRKVALKIIKPGMDTRDVTARFEAERQALALMDHPNIARVLDAGTTDNGRPYFVMELIRGVPMTQYCDEAKLDITQRLELFTQVCKAIQHAHQKGIIHRDIKPSNVLVTLHDGRPVPKVIDFGIAKALNQRLTDKTIYTRVHQAIGTLAYMSPEQAELSGLDVDTRTDVYGLGVLLYELLTGTTPFDTKRLNEAALHEACRIIREEEPPRASNRISTLGETATAVSIHRSSSPDELAKQVRGDLDWIVLKSLDKDRTRRYESASALAKDVDRYLTNEPIEARPPTTAYRLQKFVSRNRKTVLAIAATIMLLIAGIAVLESSKRKLESALSQLQTTAYEQAMLAALMDDRSSAEEALEVAATAGVPLRDLDVIRATIAMHNGEFDKASRLADGVLKQEDNHVAARSVLALSQFWQGYIDAGSSQVETLSRIEPKTELEHLLMAQSVQLFEPEYSNQLLDRAGNLKHSPVGLLLQGIDLAEQAEDGRNPRLAEDALFLYRFIPDNPGVMGWRAAAISHLIGLQEDAGEIDDSLLTQAGIVADAMEKMEANPFLDYNQWQLLRAIGKHDAASAVIARSGGRGYFSWFIAVDCLTRFDSTEAALGEFDRVTGNANDNYVSIARAFLLHGTPGGQQKIKHSVKELAHDQDDVGRKFSLLAFCLAGDIDEVARVASEKSIEVKPDRFATSACLAYLADSSLGEEWLLSKSPNGYAATNAHFTIAMTMMAKGDRAGAIKHFGLCRERIIPGNIAWEMSNAFYQRMTADPNWPHWLAESSAD